MSNLFLLRPFINRDCEGNRAKPAPAEFAYISVRSEACVEVPFSGHECASQNDVPGESAADTDRNDQKIREMKDQLQGRMYIPCKRKRRRQQSNAGDVQKKNDPDDVGGPCGEPPSSGKRCQEYRDDAAYDVEV